MELSILVAKILAITYIATGISALSGKITYARLAEDFERSPGLTFTTGFFTLVFGMVLVTYHNIWVSDWTVLVTLVGWLSVLKGVVLMTCPQAALKLKKSWYKNTRAWGLFMLAFGALFGYFGFIG